jgi:translation initiation factor 1
MRGSSNSTPVYSTETGRIKPVTANKPASQQGDGIVRLRREVKGRAGGTVIVISGITLAGGDLRELAGALKKRCGCGGTAKGGVIEIQGDHRDALMIELQQRGYKVKLAGG